jgi:hypothetical protein
MQISDGPRQIIAALIASGSFLALFFPASLVWWAALGLSAVVYFALLLVIPRRPPPAEIMVSDQVSAADIARATAALTAAITRLDAAAKSAPKDNALGLPDLSATSPRSAN